MSMKFASGIYIDGKWVQPASKAVLDVHNPATGELIASIPAAGRVEAQAAVDAAAKAFKGWSNLNANQRAGYLRKANALFIERADEIGRIMTIEQGKPIGEAVGEVLWGADYLLWYAEEIRRSNGTIVPSDSLNTRFYLRRRARGVVACITPWNFPNAMLLRKIAPAVAAGNTIVAKHRYLQLKSLKSFMMQVSQLVYSTLSAVRRPLSVMSLSNPLLSVRFHSLDQLRSDACCQSAVASS